MSSVHAAGQEGSEREAKKERKKGDVLQRLVQLVPDNVPSADHLADLEDTVRLDGVEDPALVLS